MTTLKPCKKSLDATKVMLSMAKTNDFSELLEFGSHTMPFRQRVMLLEDKLMKLPSVDIPIEHHFGGGIYARTMIAPRGTLLTGKIYKKEQLIILSKGDISICSESFNSRINGPWIYSSPSGAKRVGYCHTDVVWTCLVRTDATTIEDAEKDIYAASYEELDRMTLSDIINPVVV